MFYDSECSLVHMNQREFHMYVYIYTHTHIHTLSHYSMIHIYRYIYTHTPKDILESLL